MQIEEHEIHIWAAELTLSPVEMIEKMQVLSADEIARANRFHFPIHKMRYVAARATLRKILGLYLNIAPEKLVFGYSAEQKPYLKIPDSPFKFNLAHSHNWALFAVTYHQEVGIDIEYIESKDMQEIATRFFSQSENNELNQLDKEDFAEGFYHIWSAKEALIKAVGKGLKLPLNAFSVSLSKPYSQVLLDEALWSLYCFESVPGFKSALACSQPIELLKFFKLNPDVQLCKAEKLGKL